MQRIYELITNRITDNVVRDRVRGFLEGYLDPSVNEIWRKKQAAIALLTKEKEEVWINMGWDILCDNCNIWTKMEFYLMYEYFWWLVNRNYYQGEYSDYIKANKEAMQISKGQSRQRVFYKGAKPYYFYISTYKDSEIKRITRFDLKCENMYIREILIRFIEEELSIKERGMTRYKEFITHFEWSLYAVDQEINSIKDFTCKTYKKQYRYYKRIVWENHKAITILNRFYMFLDKHIKNNNINHEIFVYGDEVDYFYLNKNNFDKYYDNGYKVVYLNIHDDIPKYDRWIVAPNGQENKTISRKAHEYVPIDFSGIKGKDFKLAVKKWYWSDEKSLYAKDKNYYVIMKFIEFIHMSRSKSMKVTSIHAHVELDAPVYHITAQDVIQYKRYVLTKYDNSFSRNSCIAAVKRFLQHCYENKTLLIESVAFEYLKGFSKKEAKGNPILKEDLDKIIKRYKELEQNGTLKDKIHFYIIYLCLTTNLRVGEIISLERDCIVEAMKKGQFTIKYMEESDERNTLTLLRKGSHGVYKHENINKYTEQIIRMAIKETESLAKMADEVSCKYIFLVKSVKNTISIIKKDVPTRHFKKIVDSLDLTGGPYSLYNTRDTYMTNIYDQGIKKGLKIEEIHSATGHRDLRTTIKHYRASDVREYLEAFYGVSIGNVDLKGEVIDIIEKGIRDLENPKEVEVSEGCGYCKHKGCGDLYTVDCLICKWFITTIDKIPYFENRILKLDDKIQHSDLEHDREHLLKIKVLLIAYLEALYLLKKGGR